MECGRFAYACGSDQPVTREVGTSEPSRSASASAAARLNRRVRSRTHGGVGGRRGQPRLRPDDEPLVVLYFANKRYFLFRVSKKISLSVNPHGGGFFVRVIALLTEQIGFNTNQQRLQIRIG